MNDLGLLPNPHLLRLDHIIADTASITVVVATTSCPVCCPLCQRPSARVHSHYDRTLADAPWHQVAVRLRLHTRRFFCDNATCRRAIFTEPLPGVAARYGRRTLRLQEALYLIGLGIGGAGGARLAQALGMASSPDTLLRLLRQAVPPAQPTPRVLGVDDWAFRKGQRYGTILCDLEQRCVVDLLPERSAESLAQWLHDHPGVEIISRDRSPLYSQGATVGAPAATQVADRWHLLKNLREAFERLLDRQHSILRQAAQAVTEQLGPPTLPLVASTEEPTPLTRPQRLSQQRRDKRYGRYEEVTRLSAQGMSIRRIADQLGMGRHTIRRLLRAEAFPERQGGGLRSSQLNPFKAYLRERWEAGCHNATQLWREIQSQGFTGQGRGVRRYLGTFRAQLPAPQRRQWHGLPQALKPMVPTPSARRASWLLLYPEQALAQAQRRGGESVYHEQTLLRERLCEVDPQLEAATKLAQAFIQIVQEQRAEGLEPWLEQVAQSAWPELRHFATGLRQDMKAIVAALTVAWSNGQVEGRVNRLKLIKRQMYGRANFDLLRLRVLAAV